MFGSSSPSSSVLIDDANDGKEEWFNADIDPGKWFLYHGLFLGVLNNCPCVLIFLLHFVDGVRGALGLVFGWSLDLSLWICSAMTLWIWILWGHPGVLRKTLGWWGCSHRWLCVATFTGHCRDGAMETLTVEISLEVTVSTIVGCPPAIINHLSGGGLIVPDCFTSLLSLCLLILQLSSYEDIIPD